MTKQTLIFILLLFYSTTNVGQTDSLYKPEPGRLGVGAELGPCTGMFFLSGDASNKINNGWCYANVGLITSYKKIHFALQLSGIDGSQKADLQLDSTWKKNNEFGSVNLQLLSGYYLLNKKYFNVIPFATLGASAFNTRPDSTGAIGTSTGFLPSYSFGVAYDFKMNLPVTKKKQFPGYENVVQYLYIRLLTGVYPTYFQTSLKLNGAMYYANLSLGIYFKGLSIHKN